MRDASPCVTRNADLAEYAAEASFRGKKNRHEDDDQHDIKDGGDIENMHCMRRMDLLNKLLEQLGNDGVCKKV